jgi:hypothetical protein
MELYLLGRIVGGVVLLGVSTYTTGVLNRRAESERNPGVVLGLSALMVMTILMGLIGLGLASAGLID